MHPLITMVATVLDSVLAPLLDDNGPITQTNTPLLWTVLAWVRRQLEPYVAQRPRPPVAEVVAGPPVAGRADIPGVHDPIDDPDAVRHGLPEHLERQVLIDGLVQPTDFRFLPNGDILVAEKGGAIKLFHDGHVHAEPVITLVTLPTDTDEERGLLGIELDPDFDDNGYLYVSYTTAQNFDRLSRLTVTGHTADPASEVVLMESDQPGNIYHHGGEVHFGPDGKLYWAMGMNTYNPNSQNLSNVHGKILRLNPDGTASADNPFLDTPGAIPQIWAYGLRNPFRFTFTPDGQLLSGDVGGDAWEELNIVTGGANYGWPSAEGVCTNCGYVNPIYTYAHTPAPAKAGSITSVMVYTGDKLGDEYLNKVFIADYTLGWIKTLTFDSQFTSFISEEIFDDDAGTAVKLAQGPDGNIYQLNIFPGTLSRIVPSGGNRAPSAVITAGRDNGLPPLAIDFSSAGSTDPDPGTTLTYAWDFGDGTTSAEANPTRVFSTNGSYLVTLTVSDGEKTGRATQRIVVGSTAPTATITSPVQNSQYSAGDVLSFTGVGADAEDGVLPDAAYKWTIQFGHADHVHPFRDNIIGPSGMVVLPRSSDNVDTTFYRITLTVTDSSGLSTTETVEIKPRLAPMTFTASDPNAVYTIDGIPHRGTFTEMGVVGVERVVGAVSPQYLPDGQLVFNSWSNGEAATHIIVTPLTGGTYTVNYDKFSTPPTPWRETDIGHPTLTGYSSYGGGVFTIRGAGGDIWGPTDEMHYVYQPFDGDGTIIARVTSQTDTDDWAKSGIIIKESATAGSKYVLLAVTPENGVTFQYDFDGDGGSAAYTLPNAWLKLERQGDVFRGYTSSDGLAWTLVGETTLAMAGGVTGGLAVTSHKYDTLNTTRFDNVSIVSGKQWRSTDVGGTRLTGSTTHSGGTYTLTGSGDDIWGGADQMHLAYQSLPGDGVIVAHVASFTGVTDGWAKAGVIVKQSAAAGAPYALLAVTPANGVNFQHGFNANSAAATTGDWLKLVRAGNTVTGLVSVDGLLWTEVGSATVPLGDDAIIGMFVSAHDGSALATATFDQVSVDKSATSSVPPAPWVTEDVGAPRLAGSATYAGGTFTVNGAGDDIWGEADQFHFVHQSLTGDGDIVARVAAQESGTDDWAKSGVMIKQSAAAGAPYVLVAVTPANGVTMQHGFAVDVGSAPHTPGEGWVRLSRSGTQLTGYTSADGVTWTRLGTVTLDLGADVEIGLFVTSHNGSQVNTSVFDHVVVTGADVTAPAAVAV
ncbi:PQQ-dependent sugar dehydrogenase [Mycobacterium sp. ITM-2016-00317]|uniref:PQQ-dependent sugar dehydrogenase n=1 Tax=Mycobacterium sp. ITM-2016-00317 TaxID=2099694 RepID=UPI00287F7179|nr:PQQ-dependent sugar dehydrogenase [Mycobacterium sp. ITM-2016-00317]WNG86274.1 PQQ-dependent sugar dehydrogenase [Mycobacterium sp. ITM-2016-00317]